jgi:hypothetical protein
MSVEVAVGVEPQTALMQYSEKNPGETHVTSQIHGKATQVPMARLDDVLSDLGVVTVDYLKIDVEGYELAVLRGAKRVIDASPNIIIQTELINAYAERYGHAAAEAAELLLSMAFSPHEVDRLGVPHVVSKDKTSRQSRHPLVAPQIVRLFPFGDDGESTTAECTFETIPPPGTGA